MASSLENEQVTPNFARDVTPKPFNPQGIIPSKLFKLGLTLDT